MEVSTVQHLKSLIIDLAVTGKFSQGMFPLELGSEVVRNSIEMSYSNTTEDLNDFFAYCEVPNNWAWANTEILCHTQTGATPDKSALIGSESIVYITSADIQGFRAHSDNRVSRLLQGKKLRIAPAGSILFVGIGNVGRCGVTEIESTFNQQIHSATPYLVNPKFLCFLYSSTFFKSQIKRLSSSTTLTILNKSKWSSIPVPVPPIVEQQWIVGKIEELFRICDELETKLNIRNLVGVAARNSAVDAISTAQTSEELHFAWQRIQNNWDLIANTPASIESLRGLILDLAVTGRLTRSSSRPNHGVTRDMALSETPWGLFAPKDWNLTTLGDACLKISDGTHKTPKYQESGVPFLSIKDISSGIIDFSKTRFISQSEHDELCKRIKPSRGDVLFCRIGTLGKAIAIETDREFSIFVSLGLLRPKHHLNPKFLELALNSPISHKQFESIKAGGSHTQKLNLGAMSKYIIWYPDPATQSEIVQQVYDLMTLCDQLELKMMLMESLSEKFAQSVVFSTT